MVGGMGPVDGGIVLVGTGIRADVIDIFVAGAGNGHQAVGRVHFICLAAIDRFTEVASLAPDGPLENQRLAGMRGLDGLDEGEEPLAHLGRVRIREAVEQKAAEVTEAKETVEQAAAEAKAVTEQKATE